SCERGHVYDCSTARLKHCTYLIFHTQKRSTNICTDAAVEVCRIDLGKWSGQGTVRRIVERHVKAPKGTQRSLYELLNGSGVADIYGQWKTSTAGGFNAVGNGAQRSPVASR